MKSSRRDFVKLGAAGVAGALLPASAFPATGQAAGAAPSPERVPFSPAPAGQVRLLTFGIRAGMGVPRIGALTPDGSRVVDLLRAAVQEAALRTRKHALAHHGRGTSP